MLQEKLNLKKEREAIFRNSRRVMLTSSVVILIVGVLVSYFASRSHFVRELERQIAWPLQFSLRDQLGKAPVLSSDLTVIMFDDSTVEALKKPYLNFSEWASVLSYLDSHKPAGIYIDKIFGVIDGDVAQVRNSLPALRMLRTRVAAGVYSSAVKIPGRPSLDLSGSQYSARHFLPESYSDVSEDTLEALVRNAPVKDITNRLIYGPTPELRSIFMNGHIDWPTAHEIVPLYKSGSSAIMPALSLAGDIGLKIESSSLSVNGKQMPLTSEGALLVNWLNPNVVYSKAVTLLDVLTRANSQSKWSRIQENSHILILPQAFTGSADFIASPYGPAFGGMVHASVLNSVLSHRFLAPKRDSFLYFVLLVFLGVALQRLRGLQGWGTLFFASLALTANAFIQFVYFSRDVPWFFGNTIFLFSGISVLSLRAYGEKRKTALLFQMEQENERLIKEETRLSNEMADAAKIAQALLPESTPDWSGYWISGFHKSASKLSGDWYFFEKSSSGRYGHFVLCDITGHGVQAALVVSCCKTILTELRLEKSSVFDSPQFGLEYAARLNSVLFRHGQGRHSTTFISVTFDFFEGSVSVVNCGHTFPVWHNQGDKQWGALRPVTVCDPLGFHEEAQIQVTKRDLERGGTLIVYSDGTLIFRHRRILRRYFQELDAGIQIPAKRLLDAIVKENLRRGLGGLEDDASLVVFKRLG